MRRFTPEEDERLIALYRQGVIYTKIGEELDRPKSSIEGRLYVLVSRGRIIMRRSRRAKRITVRVDASMYEKLRARAFINRRTVTTEIYNMLKRQL